MAKKVNGGGKVVYAPGIDAEKVKSHSNSIKILKQALDDARMDHAQAWKDVEEAGIHKAALKHVLKLKGQAETKTRDFQTHAEAYADILGLNKQLELFDQAQETEARQESVGKASEAPPPP